MHLKLKTAPSEDPVTVTEAKDYLRVDGSSEDTRILAMIKAATDRLEQWTDQKFIHQTWLQYMDCFPRGQKDMWWDGVKELPVTELYLEQKQIHLAIGPLVSVTEFNTYADDGVKITFDPTNYVLDTAGFQGRIALKIGAVWPTTILRRVNGIEIEFVCGMSSAASSLPVVVKQAVLEYVAQMYEARGDEKTPIPNASMMLLEPYRKHKVGMRGGN